MLIQLPNEDAAELKGAVLNVTEDILDYIYSQGLMKVSRSALKTEGKELFREIKVRITTAYMHY